MFVAIVVEICVILVKFDIYYYFLKLIFDVVVYVSGLEF